MPPPILPRNMKKFKFLDVDPLEIARQFTIMDSKLFAKITVDECLAKAWPKNFANKPTPNFTAIADLSNAVSCDLHCRVCSTSTMANHDIC